MVEPQRPLAASLRTEAAGIERAMADIDAIVAKTDEGLQKLRESPADVFVLLGAGGLLHGFYSTFEALLREVAETVNGLAPAGDAWHARLLDQMSRDVPGVRPRVFPPMLRDPLDELRAFRHLFRNLYVLNLKAEKIEPLLAGLPALWADLRASLHGFAATLRAMADGLG